MFVRRFQTQFLRESPACGVMQQRNAVARKHERTVHIVHDVRQDGDGTCACVRFIQRPRLSALDLMAVQFAQKALFQGHEVSS